jgi:hypothetical protein
MNRLIALEVLCASMIQGGYLWEPRASPERLRSRLVTLTLTCGASVTARRRSHLPGWRHVERITLNRIPQCSLGS